MKSDDEENTDWLSAFCNRPQFYIPLLVIIGMAMLGFGLSASGPELHNIGSLEFARAADKGADAVDKYLKAVADYNKDQLAMQATYKPLVHPTVSGGVLWCGIGFLTAAGLLIIRALYKES